MTVVAFDITHARINHTGVGRYPKELLPRLRALDGLTVVPLRAPGAGRSRSTPERIVGIAGATSPTTPPAWPSPRPARAPSSSTARPPRPRSPGAAARGHGARPAAAADAGALLAPDPPAHAAVDPVRAPRHPRADQLGLDAGRRDRAARPAPRARDPHAVRRRGPLLARRRGPRGAGPARGAGALHPLRRHARAAQEPRDRAARLPPPARRRRPAGARRRPRLGAGRAGRRGSGRARHGLRLRRRPGRALRRQRRRSSSPRWPRASGCPCSRRCAPARPW